MFRNVRPFNFDQHTRHTSSSNKLVFGGATRRFFKLHSDLIGAGHHKLSLLTDYGGDDVILLLVFEDGQRGAIKFAELPGLIVGLFLTRVEVIKTIILKLVLGWWRARRLDSS